MAPTLNPGADEAQRTIRRRSSEPSADSFIDVLIECVKALGGSKQVGPLLWPEQAPDAAQRKLLDCLNDDRPQHLSPGQVMLIMRKAREIGCHDAMQYLAHELAYAEPIPIEPRDEADELRRQFIESTRALAKMAQRIEELHRPAYGVRGAV